MALLLFGSFLAPVRSAGVQISMLTKSAGKEQDRPSLLWPPPSLAARGNDLQLPRSFVIVARVPRNPSMFAGVRSRSPMSDNPIIPIRTSLERIRGLAGFYVRRKIFGRDLPLLASFKLTYRCNLRCAPCPYHRRNDAAEASIDWGPRLRPSTPCSAPDAASSSSRGESPCSGATVRGASPIWRYTHASGFSVPRQRRTVPCPSTCPSTSCG